jgi:hypothetical protein
MRSVAALRFPENKSKAGEFMDGHNPWIRQGFEGEAPLLAGSLQAESGGVIIARNILMPGLLKRVSHDPSAAENVVNAEMLEIDPGRADEHPGALIPASITATGHNTGGA